MPGRPPWPSEKRLCPKACSPVLSKRRRMSPRVGWKFLCRPPSSGLWFVSSVGNRLRLVKRQKINGVNPRAHPPSCTQTICGQVYPSSCERLLCTELRASTQDLDGSPPYPTDWRLASRRTLGGFVEQVAEWNWSNRGPLALAGRNVGLSRLEWLKLVASSASVTSRETGLCHQCCVCLARCWVIRVRRDLCRAWTSNPARERAPELMYQGNRLVLCRACNEASRKVVYRDGDRLVQ